jgi:hypothetical protein
VGQEFLSEHGAPVHHEATQGLPGPSHDVNLHVCAKLDGGGVRYLDTSDCYRVSEKLELWVCTIFWDPVHKGQITKKNCRGTRNRPQSDAKVRPRSEVGYSGSGRESESELDRFI